jgi:hypothetical protein
MAGSRLLKRAPRLVELAGPAGVGKSTLVRRLQDRTAAAPGTIWGQPVLPLLTNGVQLLPTLAGLWWDSGSLLWDESRHMVRLRTLSRHLPRLRDAADQPMVVFDEGPVFALAWLRGFGHQSLRQDGSAGWWDDALRHWAGNVDVVVVLDASDEELARRIKSRSTWHEVKDASVPEIALWMSRFRGALDWVLAGLTAHGGLEVIRISADSRGPAEIADQVGRRLDEMSHGY